ncbi:MAG TPA: hypothetical protein ENF99_01785 [Candidatus Aenigmarchaeota archaeon]|nr:hypothetical protein [Candidatus Aenigmarchaeota archaeon]
MEETIRRKRERAVRRISRTMRKYYFEILDENTLKFKDGTIYHWNSEQRRRLGLTLREAVEKLMEGISKYFVERTNPNQWRAGEKLFQGYNLPYKPGIGFLAASFPEGLVRLMGNYAIPTDDIFSVAERFYLSFPSSERSFYIKLLKEVKSARED